ncbi:MAG: V-type ATP synthase subunit K [Treponema sp.]|nr:V-type ATP synthase subunit K [Treponema sp.]
MLENVGLLGALGIGGSFGLSAIGAALAMAANGPAVIGSWKKCYLQNKPAPFILAVFAGTSLSNVIYGFIVMGALAANEAGISEAALFALGMGSGICIGAVAITQAMCSAAAADAYAETGKGFGNFLMVIGIAETVSLFAMVFTLLYVNN